MFDRVGLGLRRGAAVIGYHREGDGWVLGVPRAPAVCQENHTRLKLEKCEFMQETMQYLGFDVGYGWWTPAASKALPLMDAKVRHEDPKKGLHDVRSFIGACNFYRRNIKNFTYTSAILTDLIKKSTTWRSDPQEQQAFDELKDKVTNAKCLGVPRAQVKRYPEPDDHGGAYNRSPVHGPCTEGKTGLQSTNPMYGGRPLTPGASPAGACSVP